MRGAARESVALLEPAEEGVVDAVFGVVLDSKLPVDVALELAELVLAGGCGGMTPARRGEHVGQVDGLGVGHDRRDGVARLKSAGQGGVTERVDQRDPPVAVEPVPCPKSSLGYPLNRTRLVG